MSGTVFTGIMDEVKDMDKRAFKNFITKRSSIWTLSLCMTGIIVLGGIAAVDQVRRDEVQKESETGRVAYLEEELPDRAQELNDTLRNPLDEEQAESGSLAEVSGTAVEEKAWPFGEQESEAQTGADAGYQAEESEGTSVEAGTLADAGTSSDEVQEAAEAASGEVLSEQALIDQGICFTEEDALLWPSAGTILIDYSMDGSVYFPTLNQYKYNPALIIGSEVGNQVLASAKGIVESVSVDEETGNTVVLNIGNGYKLTYGQLKEIPVTEGSVVEKGTLLGYISEPTKYYSKEGGNLYFQMTQQDTAVDPVLYLE